MHDRGNHLPTASQNGRLHVVQLLCEPGADMAEATLEGVTPLLMTLRKGQVDVVQFLCKDGAGKDEALRDGAISSFAASQNGRFDVV